MPATMEGASAIAGFAVIGLQLGLTAYKLKAFCDRIKDVPSDIQYLLESLQLISAKLQDDGLADSLAGIDKACLKRCRSAQEELERMAHDLETRLASKGLFYQKFVALKAVLERDTLEKYERRLRGALETFSFASQLSDRAVLQQTQEILQNEAIENLARFAALEQQGRTNASTLKRISFAQMSHRETSQQILQKLEVFATYRNEEIQTRTAQSEPLQEALRDLTLAQKYNKATLDEILHAVHAGISSTSISQETHIHHARHPIAQPTNPPADQSRLWLTRKAVEYAFGKIATAYDRDNQSWTLRLKTPSWWSGIVYEISSYAQMSTYTFRAYNIVSHCSDIRRSIKSGDISMVCQLFQTRQASPFDVDDDGCSLLHYAAYYMQPDICKLLLQRGLGGTLDQPVGKGRATPLSSILGRFRPLGGPNEQRRDEVVEIFQCHLRNSDPVPVDMAFDYLFELEFNDEKMALFQSKFMFNLYHRSIQERAESIRHGAFTDICTSMSLRRLLSASGEITRENITQATLGRASLLHSGAVCLGRRYGDKAISFKRPIAYQRWYTEEWSIWVQDMAKVSRPEDLHALETLTPPETFCQIPQWTGTPLISLIGGMMCWLFPAWRLGIWDQAIQRALREWLGILQESGVDLLEYGRHEYSILHEADSPCKGAWDADALRASLTIVRPWVTAGTTREIFSGPDYGSPGDAWRPIRLLDLIYGREPSDWCLVWVVEFEYMACEFWKLVEGSGVVMPGTWVE